MAHLTLSLIFLVCVSLALCNAGCGRVFVRSVSGAERNEIVRTHNYLRGLISRGRVRGQPRGKNLKQIRWDNRLANEAQKIANLCVFRHRSVRDRRFAVGQNLAWTASTSFSRRSNWGGIVKWWFSEHKNFRYPNRSRGVTGHYTQVVWANTYLVGCGYTMYKRGRMYEKLYVCNYGPAGNWNNQAPYRI